MVLIGILVGVGWDVNFGWTEGARPAGRIGHRGTSMEPTAGNCEKLACIWE